MVGMPTKRTSYGSQGKVEDVDKDKDNKKGLIHPSPVSHSPVQCVYKQGITITFVNPCFCSPIKQTPLMFQAPVGSIQGRCPEGLNELSFPISNGWDVTGSH